MTNEEVKNKCHLLYQTYSLDKAFDMIRADEHERSRAYIEALKAYIVLLGDELLETAGQAAHCGWRSTRYEEGVKQRARIETLKLIYEGKEE